MCVCAFCDEMASLPCPWVLVCLEGRQLAWLWSNCGLKRNCEGGWRLVISPVPATLQYPKSDSIEVLPEEKPALPAKKKAPAANPPAKAAAVSSEEEGREAKGKGGMTAETQSNPRTGEDDDDYSDEWVSGVHGVSSLLMWLVILLM